MATGCYDKFLAAVTDGGMLRPDDRVLVGLSGGADSVALLRMLHRYREEHAPDLWLGACHVHHGLRGAEADADEAFCRELCAQIGIALAVAREEVARLALEERIGIEEAGRRLRYAAFERVASRTGATKVALGHQRDDQVETILLRIARGCGLRGMAGVPARRPLSSDGPEIVRPLLGHTRAELRAWLVDNGFRWREDASNRSLVFARNRARHVLLPALRVALGEEADDLIVRMGRCAALLYAYARQMSAMMAEGGWAVVASGEVRFAVERLRAVPEPLRVDVLRRLLEWAGHSGGALSEAHWRALVRVAAGAGPRRLAVPGGLGEVSEGMFRFVCPAQACRQCCVQDVPLDGQSDIAWARLRIVAALVRREEIDFERFRRTKSALEEVLDLDALRLPMRVRPWRPGDRFRPLGAPGERKVQDVLTDARVPRFDRHALPILEDAAGIVWVGGVRLAHRVRVTDRTRRLLHVMLAPLADGTPLPRRRQAFP